MSDLIDLGLIAIVIVQQVLLHQRTSRCDEQIESAAFRAENNALNAYRRVQEVAFADHGIKRKPNKRERESEQ